MKLQMTLEKWKQRPFKNIVDEFLGMCLHSFQGDVLHVCCKDVVPEILGTTLWTLTMDPSMPGSCQDRAHDLLLHINEQYDLCHVKHIEWVGRLKWSMICSSMAKHPTYFPVLHSINADQLRNLVRPVLGSFRISIQMVLYCNRIGGL